MPACSLENIQVFIWLKPSISGVIQGNKLVFSFRLRIVTCPTKNRPHQARASTAPHTAWLRSSSSFNTFSLHFQKVWFQDSTSSLNIYPNSTKSFFLSFLNLTFFYVVQLPCTRWCPSFIDFPQYRSLGVFCQLQSPDPNTMPSMCFVPPMMGGQVRSDAQ